FQRDGRALDFKRVVHLRHRLARKLDVHDGADDLYDFALVHWVDSTKFFRSSFRRKPESILLFNGKAKSIWITRRILRLALRAIGFADVRFGILPSQSGSPLRGVRNNASCCFSESLIPIPYSLFPTFKPPPHHPRSR